MRYDGFVAGVALSVCISAPSAEVPKCQMPPECKDGCAVVPIAEMVRMYQITEDWMSKHRT